MLCICGFVEDYSKRKCMTFYQETNKRNRCQAHQKLGMVIAKILCLLFCILSDTSPIIALPWHLLRHYWPCRILFKLLNLSNLLHGFVNVVKYICQNCTMYLLFALDFNQVLPPGVQDQDDCGDAVHEYSPTFCRSG